MSDALELIEELSEEKIKNSDFDSLRRILANTRTGLLIDLIERQPPKEAAVIYRLLEKGRALNVFEALDSRHQKLLLDALRANEVTAIFDGLDPDDRATLLEEMPAKVAQRMLRGLPRNERELTSSLLGYSKDSVGRWMSPEVLTLHPDYTVAKALVLAKQAAREKETIYTLPVVDAQRVLVGVVSLRDLIIADDDARVGDLMAVSDFAYTHDNAERAAREQLDLSHIAIPVVDAERRVVGILTFDDAAEIIDAADTQDSARSGAAEPLGQPYLSTSIFAIVRSRVVWLLVLAISAILTVHVLDIFEATLAQVVTLALFVPLLTGTGGNTGNQAATTVTRALALGDVRTRDALVVAGREMRVGAVLGLTLGAIAFLLGTLVYGYELGAVLGLTLLSVCTMAATVGGIMPIFAKKLGADPAVFSNPFISTFCDSTGLLIYFGIAKAVLGI